MRPVSAPGWEYSVASSLCARLTAAGISSASIARMFTPSTGRSQLRASHASRRGAWSARARRSSGARWTAHGVGANPARTRLHARSAYRVGSTRKRCRRTSVVRRRIWSQMHSALIAWAGVPAVARTLSAAPSPLASRHTIARIASSASTARADDDLIPPGRFRRAPSRDTWPRSAHRLPPGRRRRSAGNGSRDRRIPSRGKNGAGRARVSRWHSALDTDRLGARERGEHARHPVALPPPVPREHALSREVHCTRLIQKETERVTV